MHAISLVRKLKVIRQPPQNRSSSTQADDTTRHYILYNSRSRPGRPGGRSRQHNRPRERSLMHYEVEQKFVLADPRRHGGQIVGTWRASRPANAIRSIVIFRIRHAILPKPTKPCAFARSMGKRWSPTRARRSTARRKRAKRSNLPLPAGATTADDFGRLFEALGFAPVAEVRKHRRTFHLAWQGHEVEAALDEVAGLGHFVELEISASERDARRGPQALAELGRPLGTWRRASAAAIWNCCSTRPAASGRLLLDARSSAGKERVCLAPHFAGRWCAWDRGFRFPTGRTCF